MNKDIYLNMVMNKPAFRAMQIEAGERTATAELYMQSAIDKVATYFDFPFAIATHTELTVAAQSEYEFHGANEDCRDIISIRYDTGEMELEEYTRGELDAKYGSFESIPSEPVLWVRESDRNGFPLIRLVGADAVGGKNLKYRYRRKNIGINEYPDEWVDVLITAQMTIMMDAFRVEGGPFTFGDFDRKFAKKISRMVSQYEKGSGSERPALLGWGTMNRNIERNKLHGL
jgi:hypothetical protein